jgi:RNA polymerase sigma-70 factor (ECF subfamily)
MDQVSDVELIRNCQRGEKSSFKTLVDRYKDRVYNTAFRIVGNAHDAEDVAQETFIAAYRSIGSFDLSRKFAPWLLKIATNLSIDHLRRKRPTTVPLDSLEANAVDVSSSLRYGNADPLQAAETSELCQLAEKLISRLPPKYRAAITLYYTEDLTYGEIAGALDIPMGTVKTYLHRGREILKTQLQSVLSESVKA